MTIRGPHPTLNFEETKDFQDLAEVAKGCGIVEAAGKLPIKVEQDFDRMVGDLVDFREDAARKQGNPCQTCPCNTGVYNIKEKKLITQCDVVLATLAWIKRDPRKARSPMFYLNDMIDLWQSCETWHIHQSAEDWSVIGKDYPCHGCPCDVEIRVDHKGARSTSFNLCDVMEEYNPRKLRDPEPKDRRVIRLSKQRSSGHLGHTPKAGY